MVSCHPPWGGRTSALFSNGSALTRLYQSDGLIRDPRVRGSCSRRNITDHNRSEGSWKMLPHAISRIIIDPRVRGSCSRDAISRITIHNIIRDHAWSLSDHPSPRTFNSCPTHVRPMSEWVSAQVRCPGASQQVAAACRLQSRHSCTARCARDFVHARVVLATQQRHTANFTAVPTSWLQQYPTQSGL